MIQAAPVELDLPALHRLVAASARQARAANPSVVVLATLSTAPGRVPADPGRDRTGGQDDASLRAGIHAQYDQDDHAAGGRLPAGSVHRPGLTGTPRDSSPSFVLPDLLHLLRPVIAQVLLPDRLARARSPAAGSTGTGRMSRCPMVRR